MPTLRDVEPLSGLEVIAFVRRYFGASDSEAMSALDVECIETSDETTRALATLARLSEEKDVRT